jgi:hypothetical protein
MVARCRYCAVVGLGKSWTDYLEICSLIEGSPHDSLDHILTTIFYTNRIRKYYGIKICLLVQYIFEFKQINKVRKAFRIRYF